MIKEQQGRRDLGKSRSSTASYRYQSQQGVLVMNVSDLLLLTTSRVSGS